MTQPLFYWNEKHAKSQARQLNFTFQITAAKTVSAVVAGQDCFSFFDAITQAQIDAYLGNSSDFAANLFDSTSMGNDTFGGIVRMSGYGSNYGQALQCVRMEAFCASGAGLATVVSRYANGASGLTASTLETACGISTAGNLAFKIDFSNTPDFDALTAGLIGVKLFFISK